MLERSISPSPMIAKLDNVVNGVVAESVHGEVGSLPTFYSDDKSNKDDNSLP